MIASEESPSDNRENASPGQSKNQSTPERTVRGLAVDAVLAFLLAESKRGHSPEQRRIDRATIIRLRDSLSYRAEALAWHVNLLRLLQHAANRRLEENFRDKEKEFQLQMWAGQEQNYAFDDLFFNALALFDYLAGLIGFSVFGDRRRKAKWDGIQKFARDERYNRDQNPRSLLHRHGSGLASAINAAHASLVSRLAEYRADLIHYEARVGLGEAHFKLGANNQFGVEYDLRFSVSSEFAKRFTVSGYEQDPSKMLLLDAANWLVAQVEDRVMSLLTELRRHLRLEAGLDPDGVEGVVEML